ncbi:hypothetical protein ACEN4K_09045 [Marinilactibacillus psychrotolerans]|uniref:hypothetical protein n=1 Tax=Marinilactibacillus psychrotolerans TaxID=191770 RepID=UPI003885EA30
MNLQVRISIDTALILEELKDAYQKSMGINFSKSDVLIKAVNDTFNEWHTTSWNNLSVKTKKHEISDGALRPKFSLPYEIENKIIYFKEILPKQLTSRSVTLGVCIKYILKLALFNIQKDKANTINEIIESSAAKYQSNEYSNETKSAIKDYMDSILVELENHQFI